MSEQRRLNLEAELRELETERAVVERKIARAGTAAEPELTHQLTMLQARIGQTERELLTLTGGDARNQARDRAVLILNQRLVALEGNVRAIESSVSALEDKLNDWFAAERQERHRGWRLANAYRVAVVVLLGLDLAARLPIW